jgi:hypothetical protein
MDAEQFKSELAGLLKPLGFSKSSATWRKDYGESIAVLNVQKSSWGDGSYYVNVGTYFKALGADVAPAENVCHVQERIPIDTPDVLVRTALEWFSSHSTYAGLRGLHAASRLQGKGLVMKALVDAIST